MKHSRSAKKKGEVRKRRRKRAERREATAPQREAHNRAMRAAGHPGWSESNDFDDDLEWLNAGDD